MRSRRRYFIGELDPCASIEFTRGCPWDCSFCSAWTFYGRSYRLASPDRVIDDLASIKERGVFIVDDVAFIQDGFRAGETIRHWMHDRLVEELAKTGVPTVLISGT